MPKRLTRRFDRVGVEDSIRQLLTAAGEDVAREGLAQTPQRYARFLKDWLQPEPFHFTTFDAEGSDEMIVQTGCLFFSLCEHHMLPFSGHAAVGYLPNGRIVGLSKLARAVRYCARGFQNQERITNAIADLIEDAVHPKGIGVVLRAEHLCYDRDTELLTERGWVRFDALKSDDVVAQVEPTTLEMSLVRPLATQRFRYHGPVVAVQTDTVDLCVTPDHRMLYQSDWTFRQTRGRGGWRFGTASEMPQRAVLPQAALGWSGRRLTTRLVGGESVDGDDACRFFGAWIAEGCTRESKRDTVISQDIGPFEADIWRLLQRLPFGFRRVVQANRPQHVQFKSSHGGLYAELEGYGKSGDKRLPRDVANASSEQLELWLDWYGRGDGHMYTPVRWHYVSKSHGLIDDVQEVLVKLGRTGGVQRYDGCSRLETRHTESGLYKWYGLTRSSFEPYSDEVFCVTVPTGAVMVRRGGKTAVCGNCMSLRGVQAPGTITQTSCLRGCFREDAMVRAEFLDLALGGRNG